jgi:ribosomal protein S18 acetylase RimI-like enzyme
MITVATIEDVHHLSNLINSAYRGESGKQGWTTETDLLEGKRTDEEELTQIIEDPKSVLLKYTEENTLLGCVLLVAKETQLYLGMLTVSPKLQNSGIGKKMLVAAEEFAKKEKLTSVVMTVISIRIELIDWYKRQGYKDTGLREPFPVSDTHIPIGTTPLEFMILEKIVL